MTRQTMSRRGVLAGLPAAAAIMAHRAAYDEWQATPDEVYGEDAARQLRAAAGVLTGVRP
jgi:hypothetical protein